MAAPLKKREIQENVVVKHDEEESSGSEDDEQEQVGESVRNEIYFFFPSRTNIFDQELNLIVTRAIYGIIFMPYYSSLPSYIDLSRRNIYMYIYILSMYKSEIT